LISVLPASTNVESETKNAKVKICLFIEQYKFLKVEQENCLCLAT
jgi:hypothetical protein